MYSKLAHHRFFAAAGGGGGTGCWLNIVFIPKKIIFRTPCLSLFSLGVSVWTNTRQVEYQRCSRTGRILRSMVLMTDRRRTNRPPNRLTDEHEGSKAKPPKKRYSQNTWYITVVAAWARGRYVCCVSSYPTTWSVNASSPNICLKNNDKLIT